LSVKAKSLDIRNRKEERMIAGILAMSVETYEKMIPFVFAGYAVVFVLVSICLIVVSRYFWTAGKEQKRIRMEMGKLAEEVNLLRQDMKDGKKQPSSNESG
jgi:hypothetical protein